MNGDGSGMDEDTTLRKRTPPDIRSEPTGDDRRSAPPDKDIWDKISILARPIAASLTALVIALIGILTQQALQHRQDAMRDIAAESGEV